MREPAHFKGRRYLTEGRLLITEVSDHRIAATCRGDGELYRLGYTSGWYCSCPALTKDCSHLIALRLVTLATRGDPRGTTRTDTTTAPFS